MKELSVTKFLYFREVNMPGGRKPKPKRGRPAEGSDVEGGQDDDGEEEEFEVGDVVWGLRYGKRAPAVVVRLEDIPQPRQRQIKSRKVDR